VAPGAWPPIDAPGGPGRLDPRDPAAALIFDTAQGRLRGDPLRIFFAAELSELDWLNDYMMDPSAFENEQDEGPNFTVEPEAEEHYDKKALTTTETDSGWDIT